MQAKAELQTMVDARRTVFSRVVDSWAPLVRGRRAIVYLMVTTPLGYLIGAAAGSAYLLPVLNGLLAYPPFGYKILREGKRRALGTMLLWALYMSVLVTALTVWLEGSLRPVIFQGEEYRQEMFTWVRTGIGAEGDFKQFFPVLLRHFSIFSFLGLGSMGLLSLVFGSILMNYMNFYYGSLLGASHQKLVPLLMGWPIWAIVRVGGFIMVGIATAEVLLRILSREPWDWRSTVRFGLYGVGLLALDVALKVSLAPTWRQYLSAAFGP